MLARFLPQLLFGMTGILCLAIESPKPIVANDDWKVTSESGGVTIYSRPHVGSKLRDFKAIGQIDAPSRVVRGVIADFEAYPTFMPYTAECRLIKRDENSIVTYQRLSPKILNDRDYTLRVHWTSRPSEDGLVYLNTWEPANELGPSEKPGVLRVKVCQGGWLLEPDGPNKTRATYSIYTDSGGAIPSFLANKVSEIGIGRLFGAIRKRVTNPKYNTPES
jgi:Polyketide cyclase / dehydrase and lipid transport